MNITLLANRDLASNLALNHLLPRLAGQHRLRVFLSEQVGDDTELPAGLLELRFFEQVLFNDLLFPALDMSEGSDALCTFGQLETYTAGPILALEQPNSEEGLQALRSTEPELIVSIRYGHILQEAVIAIPSLGVINLHSGLLPDYRGVMATFRAMLAREPEIGATLHYIVDVGIDTGPVIEYSSLPVVEGRSYLWHVLRLYPLACSKLAQVVESLSRGEHVATHEQAEGGHYYGFPTEVELAEFADAGLNLYDVTEIPTIGQQYLGVTA